MPEITRPGIEGTAIVDPSVVDYWLNNGWKLVDPDAPTAATLVFARSKNDAQITAKAAGLAAKDWRYVDNVDDLADAGPSSRVLVSEHFGEHPEHNAIKGAAVTAGVPTLDPAPAGN